MDGLRWSKSKDQDGEGNGPSWAPQNIPKARERARARCFVFFLVSASHFKTLSPMAALPSQRAPRAGLPLPVPWNRHPCRSSKVGTKRARLFNCQLDAPGLLFLPILTIPLCRRIPRSRIIPASHTSRRRVVQSSRLSLIHSLSQELGLTSIVPSVPPCASASSSASAPHHSFPHRDPIDPTQHDFPHQELRSDMSRGPHTPLFW